MVSLALYVSNHSAKTKKTIEQLKYILTHYFDEQYTLQIIDIMEDPGICVQENIFATPMLAKYEPQPLKKIVGDICDEERMIKALELM
jgi:circadian clock protein KaiB